MNDQNLGAPQQPEQLEWRCYSIVWAPLGPLSWLFPYIGHMGICDSRGNIYDFGGPVNTNDFMFGPPVRYIRCRPNCDATTWDTAVRAANCEFRRHTHNIVFDNCHHHVAHVLNAVGYGRFAPRYESVILATWMFLCGEFVDKKYGRCLFVGQCVFFAFLGMLLIIGAISATAYLVTMIGS